MGALGVYLILVTSSCLITLTDVLFSLDANGDTASVSSSQSTEADSDSEGDSGLCTLHVDYS